MEKQQVDKQIGQKRRGYGVRLAVFALMVLVFLLYAGNAYQNAYNNERPIRFPVTGIEMAHEEVSFAAADGVMLSGWYIPTPPMSESNGATIIVAHGLGNHRGGSMQLASVLAQAGYAVFVFDHRAHGESDGDLSGLGWSEDQDVLGALAYLQTRDDVDAKRIGAAGLSLGATAVVRAAAQSDGIRAVWSDGAGGVVPADYMPPCDVRQAINIPSWHLYYAVHQASTGLPRPEPMSEAIRDLGDRPLTMVIAGQSTIEMCHIRQWLSDAGHEADGWVIEDVAHIGGMGAHPEEYAARMVEFFDNALGD